MLLTLKETIYIVGHSWLILTNHSVSQSGHFFPYWFRESTWPVNHICTHCVVIVSPQVHECKPLSLEEKQQFSVKMLLFSALPLYSSLILPTTPFNTVSPRKVYTGGRRTFTES